jgi:hypothetical protein
MSRKQDENGVQRLHRMLAHPLRAQLLGLLHERVASPKELAGETGVELGTVSYHVRVLHELGFLELVDAQPRRGALEHFYRAIVRPPDAEDLWAQLSAPARRAAASELLALFIDDAAEAIAAGESDDVDQRPIALDAFMLDDVAWQRLCEARDGLFAQARELGAEAADRIGSSPDRGQRFRVRVGTLLLSDAKRVASDNGRAASGRDGAVASRKR